MPLSDSEIKLGERRDCPGALFALTGKASDAIRAITSGTTSLRLTGAALYDPGICFIWQWLTRQCGVYQGLDRSHFGLHDGI
jgi:hypothetical protein